LPRINPSLLPVGANRNQFRPKEDADEKRAIAAQRKPEILGRSTRFALPLALEFRAIIRKYFRRQSGIEALVLLSRRNQVFFFAGIVMLDTVIVSPLIAPANFTV